MKKMICFVGAFLLASSAFQMAAISADQVLNNLKKQIAPDKRTAIWDVKVEQQASGVTITGTVGLNEQKDAISKELAKNGFNKVSNQVKVLHDAVPDKIAAVRAPQYHFPVV